MAIIEYDTQEEMDVEFERIMELNEHYVMLKETVEEKERELELAVVELQDFEYEHQDILL